MRCATALAVAVTALVLAVPSAQAAVGRTTGQAGVSAGGTSGYSVPIFAPPGTNGMTPSLTLSYDSGLGSGWIGEGWAIGGLSAIARCAQTVAQDGMPAAVTLTLSDRFCLDGNRLRLASGTYGVAGSTYRTEIENFARVTASGALGDGPATFKVEHKDGLTYWYGSTANSQIEARGSTTAREWALASIVDKHGNTVSFTYTEDATNGDYRLDNVQYTSNAGQGLAAAYKLQFTYQTQPAAEIDSGYVGKSLVKDVVRLTRVEVTYNSAIVRRYNVAYEAALSSTSKSRVQSIQECAGSTGTDCLSATTFTYQNGVAGVGSEVASTGAVPTVPYLPLDVNGDGRTDVVYSSSVTSGSGSWMVMLANSSGGFNAPVNSGILNTNYSQAIATDYNGDGRDDFLVPYSGGTWWVVQGSASGLASPVNTGVTATGAGGNARTMDLNGDGLDDLVFAVFGGGSQSVQAQLRVAGSTYAAATYVYGPVSSPYSIVGPVFGNNEFSGRRRNPDVNGDGRADFTVLSRESDPGIGYLYSWEVVLGGGAGVHYIGDNPVSSPYSAVTTGPYWPDLNGDACSDLVYTRDGYWRYRFSTCGSLGPEYLGVSSAGSLSPSNAVAVDWDADGFDDIVGVNSYNAMKIEVMRSTGEALAAPQASSVTSSTVAIVAGDVNGDGLDDLLYRKDPSNLWAYLPHIGVAPDLLDIATDGFGVTQNFDYGVLTDPTLYTKYTGAVFPEMDVQPGRWAVKRVTATDRTGYGTTFTLDYTYEGARVNLQGRGSLGFAKRIETDSRVGANLKTENVYLQSFPYTGLLASSTVKQSSGSKLRELTNTWSALSWGPPEPRSYPYVSSSTSRDYELNGTQYRSTTTVVNGGTGISATSGLVTDSTTSTTESATGLNPGSSRSERVWHSAVFDDTTNWCLGRPQTTQVIASHTLTGGAAITRSATQSWDGTYCRLASRVDESGSSTLQVTTALGYNGFGNVNSQSVTGIGMTARTTAASWGTSGQFPTSITNAESQTTSRGWNYSLGLPASATDPNGLATSWSYDTFGRRTLESRPDGTSTAWSWAACSTCGARVKYTVTQ
jgi:YD repeat-containing protein